jgi:hypothetical protein
VLQLTVCCTSGSLCRLLLLLPSLLALSVLLLAQDALHC